MPIMIKFKYDQIFKTLVGGEGGCFRSQMFHTGEKENIRHQIYYMHLKHLAK